VSEFPADFDQPTVELCQFVQPYTMTGKYALFALRKAVQYIVGCEIPGDIVECGVWRGGSVMAIARTLLELGDRSRRLHLFDTFEGMPPPTAADIAPTGQTAAELLNAGDRQTSTVWAYSPLDEVKLNVSTTGYPAQRLAFVKGRVEETIPKAAPDHIALLRLDTDWYESTYHELQHLYPRLSVGGVLIIDDYGYWKGARQAVDQYVAERKLKLLLNRVDHAAVSCVKIEA
jgi:O-methyltransferase